VIGHTLLQFASLCHSILNFCQSLTHLLLTKVIFSIMQLGLDKFEANYDQNQRLYYQCSTVYWPSAFEQYSPYRL
jgi:hypothetical protein